jgi:tetratricopeptide (TPR) repeat protein
MNFPLRQLQQAETYNFQGETNLSKNFYKNAIQDFSRALEINPNYVDALINRGSAYAELGQFNDALMDFNRALKFEKRDAEIFNKRGEIYLQNKMFNEAIKDFTCALVLNPMFSDAYLNRGRAYSEKGMPEEAMTDFKQAVKADSDQSFSFIDRAAPAVHISEDKSSNREEAERFNQLGSTDMQNEKFQDAIENFTKAISVASTEAEGYINRGRALLKLDKPDEALADFNEAVLFDPLNAPLYYWRAQAWGAKENHSNMKEDLKISCEMGHEPACLKYRELKSARKYPLI